MPPVSLLDDLPPEWSEPLTDEIRRCLLESQRTLVVLDDDPTGTQTVHDVPVLTRFDQTHLNTALSESPPLLFLSTNSRAKTADETLAFHRQLVDQLKLASADTGRGVEIISRSDSTLRGHFPLETDIILQRWPEQGDLLLLMPFFLEGGRFTIDGQHYVRDGDQLLPAHETPFAQDSTFGFRESFLPRYVTEKSGGKINGEAIAMISLETIRQRGPTAVRDIFERVSRGTVCIADGVTDRDAQVIALAVESCSRPVMARVAASYVRARAGLTRRPLLTSGELGSGSSTSNGGLVVVGSHVPKTTIQLERFLDAHEACLALEVPVHRLTQEDSVAEALANQANQALRSGRDVVIFTSRTPATTEDKQRSLRIAQRVSQELVQIVKQIEVRPRYFVAKGGITSSELASQGLDVARATVAGSIIPGVPVWRLGTEARFPDLNYVVFPGNVGDEHALVSAIRKLRAP